MERSSALDAASPCALRRSARLPRWALAVAALLLTQCPWCCTPEEEYCGDRCVEVARDPAHCGRCDNACPPTASCVSGVCACPPGQEYCLSACVDVSGYPTDPANCGGCGISCGPGTCSQGVCDCGSATSCPSNIPRCVNGLTDPMNCGIGAEACGHACLLGADCVDGTCTCPAGQTPCALECADLQTDVEHCGACDAPCTWEQTCVGGSCTCPAERPLSCGAGGYGSCCRGTGCCDVYACQREHTNGVGVPGLGQLFYDCIAIGSYDLAQAEKAARAWQASGTSVPGATLGCTSQSCLGWQTATACGVWCYGPEGDPLRGRASLDSAGPACLCPAGGAPNWN